MTKTFTDGYGRLSILGSVANKPTPEWLAIQNRKLPTCGVWYHAYPLKGGATRIHESDINDPMPTTLSHLVELVEEHGFNPASETVLDIFNLMK